MFEEIVKMIDKSIVVKPKPAVIISGQLDSAIVLYHLLQKTAKDNVVAFTIMFDKNDKTTDEAREVAKYFGVEHKIVVSTDIPSLLKQYEEIIPYLERPNFDLWVYPLAKVIKTYGRKTVYAGDGLDEHFGGYWYRKTSYLEDWAKCLTYQIPSRIAIYKRLNLNYVAPILYLDFRKTFMFYDWEYQNKIYLRRAYKGLLPDFIRLRKKERGGIGYWKLWHEGLCKYFPNTIPASVDEIRTLFHIWVAERWVKAQEGKK